MREGGEKDKLTKWVLKNGEFIHTGEEICLKLSDCGTETELQRDVREGNKKIHRIKSFSQIKGEDGNLMERLA